MTPIRILQVGLGPLGQKIARFIAERPNLQTVAAVDKNPDLIGQRLESLCGIEGSPVRIVGSVEEALKDGRPDVALLTTVSDMERITPQIEDLVEKGLPVVSTCEELSYPWVQAPALSKRLDEAARAAGVAVLGTGVNPGFLMDALPTFLTAVCRRVERIFVKRYQDAQFRRLPFQQKIGAGLSPEQFEAKKQSGTLRHVGLTESIQMIAARMGWQLSKTEDLLSPVIAWKEVRTPDLTIPAGNVLGVRQVGKGWVGEELKIELDFQAAVALEHSFDEVRIEGDPTFTSRIEGGIHGDTATCAILLNAIPQVLRATPGLKTMLDIAPVSFFG